MRDLWRCTLNHHIQPLGLGAGVFLFQCLLAVVVDGQIAHDLKQIAELCLEGQRGLRRGAQSEERILHNVLGARPAAHDARGNLDQQQIVVDECLE